MRAVDENAMNTKSISDRLDDRSQQRGSTTTHCDNVGKAGDRGTGRIVAVEKMKSGFVSNEVLEVGKWREERRREGKLHRRKEKGIR